MRLGVTFNSAVPKLNWLQKTSFNIRIMGSLRGMEWQVVVSIQSGQNISAISCQYSVG